MAIRFFYFANKDEYNSFFSRSENIVNNDYLYAVGAEGLLYKGNELIAQTGLNLFNQIAETIEKMQATDIAQDQAITAVQGTLEGYDDLINLKVDKEDGKGLSEQNFTLEEKQKLAGIEANANKFSITIDSILDSSSTNPVQNKVVKSALDGKVSTGRKINNKTLTSDISLSATDVGADETGTAASAVSTHDKDTAAHIDMQNRINTNTNNLSTLSGTVSTHTGNENIHLSDDDRNKLNTAYDYVIQPHASKAFTNVTVGTTTISADSANDTFSLKAGDGVSISANTNNNTITISSLDGVTSITEGSTNGTINVDGNDVKVKGLGSIAYEDATTFSTNLKTAIKTEVRTDLVEPHTSNTAIHVSETDRTTWNNAATNLSTHTENTAIHMSSDEKSKLITAYNHSQSTHASIIAEAVSEAKDYADNTFSVKGHNHDTDYYKKNEVDTKLNNKVDKTRVYQAHEITISPNGPWDVLDDSTNVENMLLSADTEISDLKQRTSGVESSIEKINSNLSSHTGNTSNPHGVDKTQIGLGNVENKSSATIRGEITKANVTTALGYTPYTQAEVNTLLGGKANSSHQQAASTITVDPLKHYTSSDVQTALEAMETDIQANETGLNSKVPTSTEINGKKLTGNIDLSADDVGAAKKNHTHDNYVNQEAFSNVKVGSTTIAAKTAEDALEIIAGDGITLDPNATNNKITITNSGVRTVTTGSTNGTIAVNGANVSVKGLGSAAYTASTAYDAAGTAANKANTAESNAKSYTDTKIANLINGAPETLNTLGEIATAMANNQGVVEALDEAIGKKSDVGHTHDDRYYTETEVNDLLAAKVNTESGKGLSTNDYTTDEKNKLKNIAAGANAYVHPSYTAKSSGLYKVTVDSSGHVSATSAVAKADITALGIPSTNTTYSNFVKSGSGAAAGLVPAPPTTAGSTKYLREDGTWQAPPDTNTTYSKLSQFTNDSGYITGITKTMVTSALGYEPPQKDTTYGAATSTALGLIKSGGDITVDSSGVVSVNNNSHKHTVSNISDLTTTAAELNVLDGITATTAELNYVAGVTSGIQGQINTINTALGGKSDNGHTHKYAGSSSAGGSASSAVKLNSSAGSTTKPVYFKDGKPTEIGYTIQTSVPEKAVFTDTHYRSSNAVSSSATGTQLGSSASASNGNVYLNHFENNSTAPTSSHKITGSGRTSVTATGTTITISTPEYSVATSDENGLVNKDWVDKIKGIGNPANIVYTTLESKNLVAASGTTAGIVHSNSSNVTEEFSVCPISNGKVYYKDTNTTYTAGTGISISSGAIVNTGVRSIAKGSTNGTISVNTGGTSAEVAVAGLGSAAYTASTAYATSGHNHDSAYLGKTAKASSASSADVATKLGSSTLGGSTQPIYLNGGAPTAIGYTIQTSVPSGAVFTDTKVTQTNTTGNAAYRVLLSGNANDTTETTTARKSTNLTFNPSTGVLNATKLSIGGGATLSWDSSVGALVISFS